MRTRVRMKAGPCSSVVEHSLGKGEVACPIHVKGTTLGVLRLLVVFVVNK